MKRELNIAKDVVKKQLSDGKIPKEQIYKDGFDFLTGIIEDKRMSEIIDANHKASCGIRDLQHLEAWTNLGDIAIDAMKTRIEVFMDIYESNQHHFGDIMKFKLYILGAGLSDFKKYLTEEGQEKFNLKY